MSWPPQADRTSKDRLRHEEEGPLPKPGVVFPLFPGSSVPRLAIWRRRASLPLPGAGNWAVMAEVKVKVQPPDADPVEIENR